MLSRAGEWDCGDALFANRAGDVTALVPLDPEVAKVLKDVAEVGVVIFDAAVWLAKNYGSGLRHV